MSLLTKPGFAWLLIASASLGLAAAHAETVKTVNGDDIDSAVLNIYIQSRLQKPAAQATAEEREQMLDELTDIYLLTSQARVDELLDDPEVQAQLELQRRGFLAQVAAADFLDRNPATDEEILAEYAQQVEGAPTQQYKARHILVDSQGTAAELISQLDDGADFSELAKENSTGPSGPSGGDLGWFAPNQMVKAFSDAVVALDDGDYTDEPVQTQFGWHVILREDSRDAEPPTLESVRDVIKQRIEQRKLQDYIANLRELQGN